MRNCRSTFEVAQMRANQLEGLGLAGRQNPLARPRPLARNATAQRLLGDDPEQRQPIDRLEILRLPDPAIQALQQEGETQAEQEPKTAPRNVFLETFGEDGEVGTVAACAT